VDKLEHEGIYEIYGTVIRLLYTMNYNDIYKTIKYLQDQKIDPEEKSNKELYKIYSTI